MCALLLTLAVATMDPAPAALDPLQGVWLGENGTTLIIDGNTITISSEGGEFTGRLTLIPRLRLLRMADDIGTLERRYRIEGRRLRIGEVDYWKRPFLSLDGLRP